MKTWYYTIDGQQYGPVNENRLYELAEAGRIGRSDLVWSEGMEEWEPAVSISGLFSLPPGPPPIPESATRNAEQSRESQLSEPDHRREENVPPRQEKIMADGLIRNHRHNKLRELNESYKRSYQHYLKEALKALLWLIVAIVVFGSFDTEGTWHYVEIGVIILLALKVCAELYDAAIQYFPHGPTVSKIKPESVIDDTTPKQIEDVYRQLESDRRFKDIEIEELRSQHGLAKFWFITAYIDGKRQYVAYWDKWGEEDVVDYNLISTRSES